MKNNKIILSIILLWIMVIVTGCGKKKEKPVEDYIIEASKAMNDGDYASAYAIVDVMKATDIGEYMRAAKDLNKKIVNNEIASLFEDKDDPLLASKINKILRERLPSVEGEEYKNILIMCIEMSIDLDRNDLVSILLTQFPIRGEKKEGLQGYYYGLGVLDYYYLPDLAEYNKLCDQVFDKALTQRKYGLAEEIIKLYKEDSDVTLGSSSKSPKVNGIEVDGDHSYIRYNWKSKQAAQKKLNEAMKRK